MFQYCGLDWGYALAVCVSADKAYPANLFDDMHDAFVGALGTIVDAFPNKTNINVDSMQVGKVVCARLHVCEQPFLLDSCLSALCSAVKQR